MCGGVIVPWRHIFGLRWSAIKWHSYALLLSSVESDPDMVFKFAGWCWVVGTPPWRICLNSKCHCSQKDYHESSLRFLLALKLNLRVKPWPFFLINLGILGWSHRIPKLRKLSNPWLFYDEKKTFFSPSWYLLCEWYERLPNMMGRVFIAAIYPPLCPFIGTHCLMEPKPHLRFFLLPFFKFLWWL